VQIAKPCGSTDPTWLALRLRLWPHASAPEHLSAMGTTLPDPVKLLQGDGKYMRHVKLMPGTAVDAVALQTLITTAYLDMRERLGLSNR
jgi:hypothetical protein